MYKFQMYALHESIVIVCSIFMTLAVHAQNCLILTDSALVCACEDFVIQIKNSTYTILEVVAIEIVRTTEINAYCFVR